MYTATDSHLEHILEKKTKNTGVEFIKNVTKTPHT